MYIELSSQNIITDALGRRFILTLCAATSKAYTVDSRYLNFGYLEKPLISKWKNGPCLNIR